MQVRKVGILFLIFTLMFAGSRPAFADENPVTKFSRGIVNIVTSPLEFVIQYMELEEDHNTAVALVGSLFNGVLFTAARIVGGAYEVVTFAVPIPGDYMPLMEPATPIDALQAIEGVEHG